MIQGTVTGIFDVPGLYPPKQYLVDIGGTLVIRDRYTCALDKKDIRVFARDNDTETYYD